jgi:hypothetical protein
MYPRNLPKRSARGVLWGERENLLPHLLNHRCPVTEKVAALCATAEWTFESYLLAALFDREELLVEVTK